MTYPRRSRSEPPRRRSGLFQSASESSANEVSKGELKLAGDWATSYAEAKEAGFRGLGDSDEAHFEVQLA